ncbi:MAG: AAA family ATPase, partial [Planctomycetota bacterium]
RMSLGQRRRLAIARALLGAPELIVLDEPLSGLDVTAVREMLNLFSELRSNGTTIVLSSHRLHEMEQVADAAAILYRGKMLHAGPLSELCGEAGHVICHVDSGQRALALARSLPEIGAAEWVPNPRPDGPTEVLSVHLMKASAADLNRVLVEGGCSVSELRSEKRDLQRAFEDLVSSAQKEGVKQ